MHIKSQKTTHWKKVFAAHIISLTYKELPEIEKKNNPIEKWIKGMNRQLTGKEIQLVLEYTKRCNKKG